ncbi:hypothetical protein GCM10009808_18710 [Microbacterium sediminicola]|uniref:Peptidase S11 D-alanyl-D-alanine carboxypeptidase A N-terminal domain-containing protein n=1 Tax=Microbacterium sediminicola TaxID=415210 RepID=A0ABN2IA28_9MICO
MTDTEAPAAPTGTDSDALVPEPADTTPGTDIALRWAGARTAVVYAEPRHIVGLLDDMPRKASWVRAAIFPTLMVLAAVAIYAGVTLFWPLTSVMPTTASVEVAPLTAAAAAPAWPSDGSAAVAVTGFESTGENGTVSSTGEASPIASITKLVTALMVLDRLPLAVGESGPDYWFTSSDSYAYYNALARGESALPVPVGQSLSEYQMLEAVLVGSANNYAQRMADQFWPTDAVFASAARSWLATHGISGVTVVEPTGIDENNTATPTGVIALAEKAMENPVIAQIVAQPAVDLPGVGVVTSTNDLIADPGVVGVKTGTLAVSGREINDLVVARDFTVGDTVIRGYATVLGEPSDERRAEAGRALLAQLETELATPYIVPAGTLVGTVETAWDETSPIRTTADASVILWNGASSTSTTSLDLDAGTDADAPAGTFTLSGPLDTMTVDAVVTTTIEGPSPWWRLTHPLELWGLVR